MSNILKDCLNEMNEDEKEYKKSIIKDKLVTLKLAKELICIVKKELKELVDGINNTDLDAELEEIMNG